MREVSRGRELARELIARVATQATVVRRKLGRLPTLAIVAGSDNKSRRFVQMKHDMLSGLPIEIDASFVSEDMTTEDAVRRIGELNEREDVDATFVQCPLPGAIDARAVSDAIVKSKDIDCSSEAVERDFLGGRARFEPVAPRAAYDLLLDELTSIAGWHVVITGNRDPFTRSLAAMLQKAEAIATIIDHNDVHASAVLSDADALVVTDKLPTSRMLDEIEWLAVLLDAGYDLRPRPPDWIPTRARNRIGIHLTQYGNVGPLTIAHLAESTVRAASLRMRAVHQRIGGR